MYTYLSSHVYMIRYTNNTYVLFGMFQASLQDCCWDSYQIAEQVTTVNLVALCGSWGLFWTMVWNRIGGLVSGRVLILWILHMLRHFDPPFSGLWKVCCVSTPILVSIPFLGLCSNVSPGAVLSTPIGNPTENHRPPPRPRPRPRPPPPGWGRWGWGR